MSFGEEIKACKRVMRLVWPLALGMANNALMQFVDRVFLARESQASLEAALPSAMLAFLFIGFFYTVAGYSGTLVAQYYGAKDDRNCARSYRAGQLLVFASLPFLLALIPLGDFVFDWCAHAPEVVAREKVYYGILMLGGIALCGNVVASGYFTGRGRTRFVFFVNLVGNLVNVVLDAILIFGLRLDETQVVPAYGIAGAAWATVASQALQWMVLAVAAERSVGWLKCAFFDAQVRGLVGRTLRFGVPAGFYMIANILSFVVFVFLTGKMEDIAFAASNAAFSVNYLLFAPLEGFAIGAATLVGQHQGAGNSDAAFADSKRALFLGEAYVVVSSALVLIFNRPILALFGGGAEFESLGFIMFIMMASWQFFDGADIVLGGALRGAGDTRFVMVWMLICAFPIWMPILFLVYWLHPTIIALWSTMIFYVIIICTGTLVRWVGGRWRTIKVIPS